jgi:hypothetical protein
MGTTILILVLDLAATVKGPNAASDARLDTRPRRTTVLDGVDRRPPHHFHPRRATARSEWLVRSQNIGASFTPVGKAEHPTAPGNPPDWVSQAPASNYSTASSHHIRSK